MSDPISRLKVVRSEIDRVFQDGHAAGHPGGRGGDAERGQRPCGAAIARSLQDIAVALVEDEEASGIMQPRELLRMRP